MQKTKGPYNICRSFASCEQSVSVPYLCLQTCTEVYLGESFEICLFDIPLMNTQTVSVDVK